RDKALEAREVRCLPRSRRRAGERVSPQARTPRGQSPHPSPRRDYALSARPSPPRNPHGFAAFPALKDAGYTEQAMQDLWRLSAADLATLVKSRKVSAREAAKAGLARLDAVNPKLNAVIDHRPEDVLRQADAVDAAIARGEDLGVLAGVPVTIKANVDQEGF